MTGPAFFRQKHVDYINRRTGLAITASGPVLDYRDRYTNGVGVWLSIIICILLYWRPIFAPALGLVYLNCQWVLCLTFIWIIWFISDSSSSIVRVRNLPLEPAWNPSSQPAYVPSDRRPRQFSDNPDHCSHPQLNLDLGPPLRVHYKEDERMTIHAAPEVVRRWSGLQVNPFLLLTSNWHDLP